MEEGFVAVRNAMELLVALASCGNSWIFGQNPNGSVSTAKYLISLKQMMSDVLLDYFGRRERDIKVLKTM